MRWLFIMFLVAIGGCATLAGNPKVQQVTGPDIDAAIAMAQAAGDADGLACWQAIKAAVPSDGGSPIDIKGAASALEAARIARRAVQGGIDPTVHRNCAVVVLDAEQTAARLGLRLGATVK